MPFGTVFGDHPCFEFDPLCARLHETEGIRCQTRGKKGRMSSLFITGYPTRQRPCFLEPALRWQWTVNMLYVSQKGNLYSGGRPERGNINETRGGKPC